MQTCEICIGVAIAVDRDRCGILTGVAIAGLSLRRRQWRPLEGRVVVVFVVIVFMIVVVLLLEQVYPLESRGEVDVVREADLAVRVRIDRLRYTTTSGNSNNSNGTAVNNGSLSFRR